MNIEGHRKQVLLFLIAVLLPVLVLVGLTLRIVKQERELAQKRIADEHRRAVREIGQALASRLDKVTSLEAGALREQPEKLSRRDYVNPEVILIAKIDDARLVLPWEPGSKAAVAASPAEGGFARLQRARALLRANKVKESLAEYEEVLSLPLEIVDEYGVPLSFYAVAPLLEAGSNHGQALERIGRQIRSGHWLSPACLYRMKDLVEQIIIKAPAPSRASIRGAAEIQLQKILAQIRTMEQAFSLKEDLPRLGLRPLPGPDSRTDEPLWVSYGQDPWLVGRVPLLAGGEYALIAVDFPAFSSALASDASLSAGDRGDFTWASGLASDGAALGPSFPGLRVVFGPDAENVHSKQGSLQRLFYFLALAVVLSVAFFGAFLLWRDVRREVLLAEMRSQFVSSVSHELKTPLTAIRMFAETLRLGRSKNPAAQTEYLDTIVNESERLTRLLNNVLDFSRIEQGTRTYHTAPASLAEVVRTAARAMEYPLKQQGFELDVRIAEDLPQVRVDRDAIEQAVLNLLSNAMKYSGESRRIDLKAGREGDRAVIQVIDRGVGIDPKDQARLFERFYRVPTPENRSLPGTGLGLSLVAHVVKAHGGSVSVESEPGKGSTFSIRLPLEGAP
jgi:signal transduction histidine kinase